MLDLLDDLIEKLEAIDDAIAQIYNQPWFQWETWRGIRRQELRDWLLTIGQECRHALIEAGDLRLLADLNPLPAAQSSICASPQPAPPAAPSPRPTAAPPPPQSPS